MHALRNQSSGVAASLSQADGLGVVPPYTTVAIGDNLEFIPFSDLLN
jgi:molybdopterin biosynthesis enzyme